ncbi:MAG: flippase-like domain-containing protein [Planctomycetales bacterium]|nr:flippase-like domain-containing protein [Planctomycetales bacterium]
MTGKDKQPRKRYGSLTIRILIAVAACCIIFKDTDFVQLGRAFKELHLLTLLFASFVFAVSQCILGVRWWLFLRAQEVSISLWLTIKLTFLGLFFSNFMPSSVGGDLVRAWYVSRHSPKKLQAALGVAVDRIMGLMTTFLIAIGSYLIFLRDQDGLFQISKNPQAGALSFLDKLSVKGYHVPGLIIILLGAGCVLAGLVDFKAVFNRLVRHGLDFLRQLKEVVTVYYRCPLVLAGGLGLTVLMQSMVILSYWGIGLDLGISAHLGYYFVFFPIVWVIGSIPVSIAGIGILEGGVVFLFVTFANADVEAVTALALCQRLTWVLASLPGLVVHLTGAHRVQFGRQG